jgi:hypothetical protein
VSKLFFYASVWQLGYVSPDVLVPDGDMPEPLRQRLVRPLYHPSNDDGHLRAPLPHSQALSHSVNKIAYRTTWGERTEAQRYAIARLLVERFGLPWQHGAQRRLHHFYRVFTADETVPLGTWQATPFKVAAMLEEGFRGSSLTPDQLILTWNGRPLGSGCGRVEPWPVPGALQSFTWGSGCHSTASRAARSSLAPGGENGHHGRRARCLVCLFSTHGAAEPPGTYRPCITFVVWAGYDDNRPAGLYGGRVHGPILRRFLSEKRVQAALRALLQDKP